MLLPCFALFAPRRRLWLLRIISPRLLALTLAVKRIAPPAAHARELCDVFGCALMSWKAHAWLSACSRGAAVAAGNDGCDRACGGGAFVVRDNLDLVSPHSQVGPRSWLPGILKDSFDLIARPPFCCAATRARRSWVAAILHGARCKLHAACGGLHVVCCMLYAARRMLHGACCLFRTVCCVRDASCAARRSARRSCSGLLLPASLVGPSRVRMVLVYALGAQASRAMQMWQGEPSPGADVAG